MADFTITPLVLAPVIPTVVKVTGHPPVALVSGYAGGDARVTKTIGTLADYGIAATYTAEGAVTSSNLNGNFAILCLGVTEGLTALRDLLNGYHANGMPLGVLKGGGPTGQHFDSMGSLLGLVANIQTATGLDVDGDAVLSVDFRDFPFTQGYREGASLRMYVTPKTFDRLPGTTGQTAFAGTKLVEGVAGEPLLIAGDAGAARIPSVGGEFTTRFAWFGAITGDDFIRDSGSLHGAMVRWLVGHHAQPARYT